MSLHAPGTVATGDNFRMPDDPTGNSISPSRTPSWFAAVLALEVVCREQ
jgi:hypothetical protein